MLRDGGTERAKEKTHLEEKGFVLGENPSANEKEDEVKERQAI